MIRENGVGLHIGDRISPQNTREKVEEVLYKVGDKSENILKLKKKVKQFFIKYCLGMIGKVI
ncbi:MAG: hypothetical protein ACR5KV_08895 [Wolbachia sp.]